MRLVVSLLCVLVVGGCCGGRDMMPAEEFADVQPKTTIEAVPEWGEYFGDWQSRGCFVIRDLQTKEMRAYNVERAQTPMLPASTFKIPNSLIALDTKVVADRSQVFKWDGEKRQMSSWERDHNLGSAFRNSVVPVYQEIARSVGEERMASYVKGFEYGNQDISGGVDRFWLDGNLRISAVQQVEFLEKLYFERLPARVWSQRNVKTIMLHEKTPEYVIRAKTGWALRVNDPVGWWVGWVEIGDKAWAFALNMELKEMKNASKRLEIAKGILKAEGLLPG